MGAVVRERDSLGRQEKIEALAFTHLQVHMNETAYTNKLITEPMYIFARDELRKSIERLSVICYRDVTT